MLVDQKEQQDQSNKSQESQDKTPDSQQQTLVAALQSVVQPLQASIQSLQQEQIKLRQEQDQQQEAEKKSHRLESTDLRSLIEEAGEDTASDDKYDKLSNKQIVEAVCTAVETAMSANNERIKEELGTSSKPSDEKLQKIEKALMIIVAKMSLDQAKQQHQDFDKFTPEIMEVMKKYPGIEYADAYLLAKSKKAENGTPKSVSDTERPNSFASRPSERESSSVDQGDELSRVASRARESRESSSSKTGIVQFRSILDEAVNRIVDSIPGT
jgi:hypothetical protein